MLSSQAETQSVNFCCGGVSDKEREHKITFVGLWQLKAIIRPKYTRNKRNMQHHRREHCNVCQQ